MKLDFIYDTICPWCFIGKRRLDRSLASRPQYNVEINWWPYLLNRNMPQSGIARDKYMNWKFGGPDGASRVYGNIAEVARADGLDLNLSAIQVTPNSVNSHRLVMAAREAGMGDQAVELLFNAYFLEGRNIGDTQVLAEIGEQLGLNQKDLIDYLMGSRDVDLVHDYDTRAHRMRVEGVPTIQLNSRFVIFGAQESVVFDRLLDLAAVEETVSNSLQFSFA